MKKTKDLGLEVMRMIETFPRTGTSRMIGNQIFRSSTSVGANYRAACRAKSGKDFINKLKIVEEEADETLYWLEMLSENEIVPKPKIDKLKNETDEIISIIVASIKTSRKSLNPNRKSSFVNRKS